MNWKVAGKAEGPSEFDASVRAELRPRGSGRAPPAHVGPPRTELPKAPAPDPASRPRATPLEAAARRDVAQVYEEHFEFVWRSLRLLGVRSDALADVSQDVFSTVARQLGRFEGRSSLRTWVFGITQNVASNHRRARARKLDPLQPLEGPVESPEPSPQAQTEGREAASAILEFCEALDESRRAVFVLGLLEGVPAPEIAALLGLPLNTVYSRVRLLREGLERHLSKREVER
ncbi:MAG TPA: RNA polymerase sigma factor [Polyangiaceae bacterium]|nr:RNA polymerase sigma factor [Polyangiaceae bacterium]